jgi:hypothetical protein
MMTLFLDLDGVLADFDRKVRELTGHAPSEFKNRENGLSHSMMWKKIATTHDFYNILDWMPDGKELFEAVKHLRPIILTGLPRGNWAAPQKRNWCARMLGPDVPVITCMADEKHTKALEWLRTRRGYDRNDLADCILIDDREKTIPLWESLGGTYILHTSTSSSLTELQKLL